MPIASQDRNHIFNNSGTYIVRCTLYYPAPTDTGIGGCTPYSYQDTVTITGAAISGGPLSFCDGGSVTLTATAGGTGYQWKKNGIIISGATTNVYVATTSGTYSITVNGINGCNPSIAAVLVTVFPKPEITATPTNVSCPSACDGAVTTSVASGTTPFTYSWSPGGATTANISSVCINTYTVIVTDTNGCKDTATATVSNPAGSCDMGTDYCGTTYAHTIGTTFPSGSIGLHGNFIVDTTFSIRHNEVKIDSGVTITINPGKTLTISDTSWLHACSSMWNGIILSNGTSSIVVDSASIVEDADTAIKGNLGGSVRLMNGDTIRRNLVGVSMKVNARNLLVKKVVFDCPTQLNDITISKYSDTHILLSDADTVNIGDSTSLNKFINATKGIDATRTWLKLYHALIYIDTTIIHTPDSATFAVKFISDSVSNYSLNMKDTLACTIQNYGYGVYSKFRTLNQIYYNEFDNCQYGVYLENIRDQRSDIWANTFISCNKNAVYLYDISIRLGWIHVNFNNINIGYSLNADETYSAIRAENPTPSYTTQVTIVYNKINNSRFGAHVTNFHIADISSNTITFPQDLPHAHSGDEYFGILAEGSGGLTIDGNTIKADSIPVAGSDSVIRGISLNVTTANTLRQNHLIRMGAGARIYGDCNQSQLLCNIFDTCYHSVFYNNHGKLPAQGTPTLGNDNIFRTNLGPLKIDGDTTLHTLSTWYFRGKDNDAANVYRTEPSNHLIVFPVDSVDSKKYKCEGAESGGGGGTGTGSAQSLASTASGEDDSPGEYANEIRYIDNGAVYRVLVDDSSLMYLDEPTDEVLQTFFSENSETNIGLFDNVRILGEEGDAATASDINDAITDTNLIEYNQRIVNQIYFDASLSDTLSLDSSQRTSLEEIAYQNPVEGGQAVYQARAMLRVYISDNGNSSAYRKANYTANRILNSHQKFSVYPVPATSFFIIKNNERQEMNLTINVFDATGKSMKTTNSRILDDLIISSNSLKSGVYSIRIDSEYGVEMHKLIIVK
ncbi:MAG: T9SS type A sorting domain-containing protein [Bacteroidota bacterium]